MELTLPDRGPSADYQAGDQFLVPKHIELKDTTLNTGDVITITNAPVGDQRRLTSFAVNAELREITVPPTDFAEILPILRAPDFGQDYLLRSLNLHP